MKIGNPTYGSFIVCDGVKFTFTKNDSGFADYWDAGHLAHRVSLRIGKGHSPDHPYVVNNIGYQTLDRAMRAAVKLQQRDVERARRLVAAYDAALSAPAQFDRMVREMEGGE